MNLGKVTSIKNQGGCGSCWAFAAIASIESKYLIDQNSALNLSEQELIDCGPGSCAGGWTDLALKYVKDNKVFNESNYPYVGIDQNCANPLGTKYPISDYF